MSVYGASVTKLIEEFEKLPSIGHKSAERLAFYLMHRSEAEVEAFANAVIEARRGLKFCSVKILPGMNALSARELFVSFLMWI